MLDGNIDPSQLSSVMGGGKGEKEGNLTGDRRKTQVLALHSRHLQQIKNKGPKAIIIINNVIAFKS